MLKAKPDYAKKHTQIPKSLKKISEVPAKLYYVREKNEKVQGETNFKTQKINADAYRNPNKRTKNIDN